MPEPGEHQPSQDSIAEGAHARALGRPTDACPYPADSAERKEWFEGYDGSPADGGPDLPIDNG